MNGVWSLLLGLFCLILCVFLAFLRTKPTRIAAVALLGCAVGASWFWAYDTVYLSAARSYDTQTVTITASASDYSYPTGYGQACDGYTELDGKTYRLRCYIQEDAPIQPGQLIHGDFRLRYTADGDERDPTYHQGKGIFLLAYQTDTVTISQGDLRLRDYPALWRQKLLNLVESAFPADTAAFAKALLLGDSTGLTYAQDRDFQITGLRHVIAVSGLHVSILFALIYLAFGHQRVFNALFGIPLLLLFAAVAGFTPSITRACVMQILMLLAMLFNKEYDPQTALSFAVLTILAVNPRAITSVSFQMSAGCIVGIFAFCEPLQAYFLSFGKREEQSKGKSVKARLIRWFFGSVSVTLSAMVITTPLCAWYFGVVSLVGILANLLALWVVVFVFYGIMLACLAAAIWLPLGQGIAWLTAWPIRYILGVSRVLADFPLAAVYTNSVYIVFWLIFSYVLLAVFFLLKRKHPGLTTAGILVMLLVCIALSWLEPTLDDTRVAVIDVGQGQSILLKNKDSCYLVDCGGENAGIVADTVSNFLLSQGIFRLDGVILTHYDADHAGGVSNLLTAVPADRIYMPDIQDTNGIRDAIESGFSDRIHLISEVSQLELDAGKITLYPAKSAADDNESSACVLFQTENCDILITGDRSSAGERALLQQVKLPLLELLVVGHHGSHYATSLDLLMATRPKAAAISVGEDNLYGHPRPEVLDRLSRFGCEIYRTDLQGTIIFRR